MRQEKVIHHLNHPVHQDHLCAQHLQDQVLPVQAGVAADPHLLPEAAAVVVKDQGKKGTFNENDKEHIISVIT